MLSHDFPRLKTCIAFLYRLRVNVVQVKWRPIFRHQALDTESLFKPQTSESENI